MREFQIKLELKSNSQVDVNAIEMLRAEQGKVAAGATDPSGAGEADLPGASAGTPDAQAGTATTPRGAAPMGEASALLTVGAAAPRQGGQQ
jgi:hypothetical protein